MSICQYKSDVDQKITIEIDKNYQVNMVYIKDYEEEKVSGYVW